MLKFLIERGADINKGDHYKLTPLHKAIASIQN
jgi:ankyrin repeat protein